MTTTAADLVREAQRDLLSGVREGKNKLAAGVSAGATSLSFTYDITGQQSPSSTVQAITPGDVLSIDLERFYVWGATPTSKTVTVEGGWDGTTPAAHATGALVTRNARFDDYAVFNRLNKELSALSSPRYGLFQMLTKEITVAASTYGYDLPGLTGMEGIYEVEYRTAPGLAGDWRRLDDWELRRNENTTDFPSGFAFFPYESGIIGQPLRIKYKAAFGQLTALTDDVLAVTGLHAEAHDIPPLGVIERLVPPREIRRNFTEAQSEPRRATEVPPGAVGQSATRISAYRMRRIAEEASRLDAQYPERSPKSTRKLVNGRSRP